MVLSLERWEGKVAIVTGASAGIGALIAEKLVQAGLKVAGFARNADKIKENAKWLQLKKGKLHAVKVDMSKENEILKGFQWVSENLGPVSILVNNAGIMPASSLTDGDAKIWKQTIDLNVLGLCIATREAVKIMKEHKIDGHIVHINSVGGHYVPPYPNLHVYPASKHAVTALTESLRQELNQLGLKIKITSISPGGVNTELVTKWLTEPDLREAVMAMPILQAEDVADAVVHVLSTPPHVQIHEVIMRATGAKD